jgi:nucleotide-binding universal stress UspA family protein
MITLRNVLVATDFGSASCAALEEGRALASAFDASLHVLHVVSEPLEKVWAGYASAAAFIDTLDHLQAQAQKRLEAMVPKDELTAGRVVVAVAVGDPSDQILTYARDHSIDLIVCGTHGRLGLDHLLMGSVAERIVRLAPCAVLTVHSQRAAA